MDSDKNKPKINNAPKTNIMYQGHASKVLAMSTKPSIFHVDLTNAIPILK